MPALREAEQDQCRVGGGERLRGSAGHGCIHHVFEQQVERAPEAVAVAYEGEQLTYAQLNSRANQIAHYLRARGIGPEVLVGICVERSVEMVVGLLGVLKAGGAYVPLDPTYPEERLQFMLQDARVSVLLTQERLVERLPVRELQTVRLDADLDLLARESVENLRSEVTAENLAYTIFTSGSTGRPKGVQIAHGSVVHLLEAIRRQLDFGESDTWTLFHSYAFDFSVWEIWGALLSGSRLVVVPHRLTRSPEELYELLRRERVTILSQTPSALRQLVGVRDTAVMGDGEGGGRLSLRRIICGGEALPPELAAELLKWEVELWNFYGPTEATVWSTFHLVRPADVQRNTIPIGFPIAGYQTYVLDEQLQPAPAGVPGELHIGGEGLARGYLNQPELTAEKFIADPFSDQHGARLYKTGDLARFRPDGTLEYLGRLDHQVKIRGFRIELEEIEAVLARHPAVSAVVVIAREDPSGDPRLVAYFVPGQEPAPTARELRRLAKEQLPDYMLPAVFVPLPALPLTPNGKVDRKALDARNEERGTGNEEGEESIIPSYLIPRSSFLHGEAALPRDALEARLAQIWQELLGIDSIGVHDDFFDLGGHSLLAARLFVRIEAVFGQKLPLATLFQSPTVAQLARLLGQEPGTAPWSPLVAIQPCGSRPPLFCIHGMWGNVLCYRELARHLGPDQPVYGLQAVGLDGKRIGPTSVEGMAALYLQEIRTVQPEGPYYLGGLSFGGVVAYEMAHQLHARGDRVNMVALFDTWGPGIAQPVAQRARRDLDNLKQLGPREQLRYLRSRAEVVRRRLKLRAWNTARRSCLALGLPLPAYLRQIDMLNRQADHGYRPPGYPGRLTLFRAGEHGLEASEDPEFGWGGLAAGGLEVHPVPGNHETNLKEPHVRVLAEKLGECLRQAQAEAAAREGCR